ncbi:MAG: hypothetical protein ACREOO_06095 [bacterium]
MKKPLLWLFVSTILMPLSLFAQPSKYLKLGVNYSSFRTEGGKSEPGLTLGFGKKHNPIQDFDGFWGFELGYARERILLEDKTWPTSFFPPYSGVVNGGFEVSLSYFDLSLYLGYLLKAKKIVSLEFFVGPSLSIPVGNGTKETGSKIIYLDPEEIAGYDFDYYHYDADPGEGLPFIERGMNLKTSMIVGAKLHWRNFHLSLNYFRAFNKTEGIISLTLFDKIDRLSLSGGVDF